MNLYTVTDYELRLRITFTDYGYYAHCNGNYKYNRKNKIYILK